MARALRRRMTLPEVKLWLILRMRPEGIRFRRQHPIGPYSLDFYCPEAKLAVEIDGIVHDMGDQPARDMARDRWLAARGIETIRIAAKDVLAEPEIVAEGLVRIVLSRRKAPPPPLCGGPPPRSKLQGG